MKTWPVDGDLRANVLSALQKSPWFGALDDSHLETVIGMATLMSYDAGEIIVRAGDPSDGIFLLMKGEITFEVAKGETEAVEVGRARPPFTFGEIGLLLDKPRTASVTATAETYVLSFEVQTFRKMFDEIPGFRLSLARGLASRLADVSEMVLPAHDSPHEKPADEVFDMLPPSFVQRHRVIPLSAEENVLTVGFVDDPSPRVLGGIRQQVPGMELLPVRINLEAFNDVMASKLGADARAGVGKGKVAAKPSDEVVIPKPLLQMLERMVAEGASDLHLPACRKPLWRIDGDMRIIEDAKPLGPEEVLDLINPVVQERHRREFASHRDTDFAISAAGVGRFRVNMFWSSNGICAALRQIPWQIIGIEKLGLPPVLKSFCMQPKGIVLVTGPTGSGKSTTLAAMVDYINRFRPCHVITLEDPVEFVHEDKESLIDQREIGTHVESFERGLRAALREDPDVILLGELREREAAQLALEMANTGHLVFATVHTNSAVSSVERVIDMFPGEMQPQARGSLADTLRGVVSQTLCKARTGGRVAAVEVLVGGPAVANLVREGKPVQLQNIMQTGGKEGNRLLNDDLARLVRERKVMYEEAESKAVDKKDLARRLGKIGVPDPTRKK